MADTELPICGIIMPISGIDEHYSALHWQRVKAVLEKAIADAGMAPQPVWENQANDVIQARILKNVYENELVICDVSSRNPNVMLELGMRLSTKKPTILVADEETNLPFDTSVIAHSFYQRDLEYNATARFVTELARTIIKIRKCYAKNEYVSFVENFHFETIAPSTISVAAEQFYADRLDDLKSVLARIEWRLDWEERPKGALSEMAPSHGMSARNVFADLAQNQIEPNADIVVGSRVMHHKFGKGTVTEVDGPKVTADFDQVGQKKVMHTFLIPMKDRLSSV